MRPSSAETSEPACTNRKMLSINSSTSRSEEHTSELQSRLHLVCRLLLEKKKKNTYKKHNVVNESSTRQSSLRYRRVYFATLVQEGIVSDMSQHQMSR